jgi:hypothetical protein
MPPPAKKHTERKWSANKRKRLTDASDRWTQGGRGPAAGHEKFKGKGSRPFPLMSDEERIETA